MPVVNPKVTVVRVDLGGGSGGTGGGFTLNGSSSSVSLVSGAGISFASNLSTITISNTRQFSTITGTMTGNPVIGLNSTATIGNNFVLSAGGILSVGATNNTIRVEAITDAVFTFLTNSLSASGNTTGATSSGTYNSVLAISGMGAISVGAGNGTISISAPTVAAGGTQSFSGGGTSITGSAISVALSGGNNISLASASGAGSLTLTINASSNALNNVSLLNASSGAMSISAGAGIGIGQANSTITVSASVQTASVSMTALGNTTSSSSGTHTNLINISGAGIVSIGAGAQSITISATTPSVTNYSTVTLSAAGNTLSTGSVTGTFNNSLVISGAGILSGAISTSGNTIILSASTPSVTNYSTISGNIAGNTAGTSTFTIGNTFQISLTGGLSGTASGSSITLSGQPAGGALTQSLSASGNTTSSSSGTYGSVLAVSGMGGVSVGAGNGSISVSGPSQTTLVAGSGISLTSGGSSITIIDTGNGVKLLQNFDLHNAAGTVVTKAGTVTGTAGVGSSLFLSRITAPSVMSLTEIDVAMSIGFPATNQGAGTLSRSMVIYSFGNSTSLASVMSVSGTSAWGTGTATAGASSSLTQFQGGWSSPLIQPMTFASTSLAPGEYVVGQLFNFAQGSSTWTLAFYGDAAASTVAATSFSVAAGSGVTGTVAGSLVTGTAAGSGVTGVAAGSVVTGTAAGSVINAITQNATNNVSWFVSRATSAVTSVASATSSFTFLEAPFVGSIGTAAGSGITGMLAGSGITGVAAGSVITGLAAAGSAITGVAAGSVLTATSALTLAQLTIPNFGYIGTGSTTSGFPTAFMAGIFSTGAIPVAITITSAAMTYSGSAAFQQPWFALVGQ